MKKLLSLALALLMATSIFASTLITPTLAAQPQGYWPYHVAYNDAVKTGNIDEILRTGDALLNFYSKHEMNYDIAANSYNVYYYRYINSVFEKRGDYKAALDNLDKLLYVSEIAGIKDIDIVTTAKARKINPRTGVFAATSDESNVLYYGAPYEPRLGSYYGRVIVEQNKQVKQAAQIQNESIFSYYIELGGYTAGDFDWLISQIERDNQAIHVAMNFPKEGQTVKEVNNGQHDANIQKTLSYLAEKDSPVFLRIGAEMNVWTNKTTPEEFKKAYIRIAQMARSTAPNVALIFSVNCVGGYGDDMNVFYPGDEYVDWVGVSLYYNRYFNGQTCAETDDTYNFYFGASDWAEPVASVTEVVENWGDRKPIMITEGGSGNYNSAKNIDLSDFASERITRAYRTLTMVYPQIKGIIYFDNHVGTGYQYEIDNSPKVQAAYTAATLQNPTLLHSTDDTAKSYVPLEKYCEITKSLTLSAYCYAHYSGNVYVDYYLDGALKGRGNDVTHDLVLDTNAISVGSHTLTAKFSNGTNFNQEKQYRLTKYESGLIECSEISVPAPNIKTSDWAKGEIATATQLSVVPDRLLASPTKNITREEFCVLIMNMLRTKYNMDNNRLLERSGKKINVGTFKDTNSNDVYVANALGILNGRGNGIFDPNSSITRQEAAVMLTNTAKVMDISPSATTAFNDSSKVASWAASAVSAISSIKDKTTGNAVMGGVGSNNFDPLGKYTREQAILTVLRLFRA